LTNTGAPLSGSSPSLAVAAGSVEQLVHLLGRELVEGDVLGDRHPVVAPLQVGAVAAVAQDDALDAVQRQRVDVAGVDALQRGLHRVDQAGVAVAEVEGR
jgi:hypothetical protein